MTNKKGTEINLEERKSFASGIYSIYRENTTSRMPLKTSVFVNGEEKVILPMELEKSLAYDGGEKIFGYFTDKVALETLTFDYDWKANGTVSSEVKDEYWMLEVFIPWSDFGLEKAPKEGTVWRGTLNRIDSSLPRGAKQGFLCLLDKTDVKSFHQPSKFASFIFR
mgnify:CR=1 FL=1